MKLRLPNSVSSLQDATALTLEIREYSRWFSHAMVKKRLGSEQAPQPLTLSPAATAQISSWAEGNPLTPKALDELIAALEQLTAAAPSLTITLAAPAPGELKQTLVSWCRQHISPDALVTFRFNATLLGGMVVRYGSHVFDWSFRRQILAARTKFPEVLRRV